MRKKSYIKFFIFSVKDLPLSHFLKNIIDSYETDIPAFKAKKS